MTNVYWGVHSALTDQAQPTIMVVADSWFWYPMHNLAAAIGQQMAAETLVCVGFSGAEASQWAERYRTEIDFGFRMYGASVQVLMLSGGGNDVAGMQDFLKIIRDDCAQARTVDECFDPGQPDGVMARITGAYTELILRFRAYNRHAPVLMHNYDYAWPTGIGVFGPADWLRAPMERSRVPHELRRPLFRALINRLREAQLRLADDRRLGPLVALQSAGTLPEISDGLQQWWANELHPTPRGFNLLAQEVFVPALDVALRRRLLAEADNEPVQVPRDARHLPTV